MKQRGEDRQRSADEKKAAISEAIEKTKQELQASPAAVPEDVTKKHAEELRALENKLIKDHQDEIARAVEAAKQYHPTSAPSESSQAAIDAAVSAREAEWKAKLDAEIAQAVERGRLEGSVKTRLKDSQLQRMQNKVKQLEEQILEWRNQGLVPEEPPKGTPAAATTSTAATPATTTTTTAPATATTASTIAPASAAAAPPTQAKPAPTNVTKPAAVASASTTSTAGPSNLPRKPATAAAAPRGRGGAVRGGAVRGAARGTGRGGISIRGQAQPTDAPVGESPAGGMSIMGASKRVREEGETTAESSLAKRLKPAEGETRPSPPVAIRRNRVEPS